MDALCLLNIRDGDDGGDGDDDDDGAGALVGRPGRKRRRHGDDGDDGGDRSQPGRFGCRYSAPAVHRRLLAVARRSGSDREGRDKWWPAGVPCRALAPLGQRSTCLRLRPLRAGRQVSCPWFLQVDFAHPSAPEGNKSLLRRKFPGCVCAGEDFQQENRARYLEIPSTV